MLELRKTQTTISSGLKIYHEEFIATQNQTQFVLQNAYTLGTNLLQVYLNGVLQRVDDDYFEIDNNTITFKQSLYTNDKVTCKQIF